MNRMVLTVGVCLGTAGLLPVAGCGGGYEPQADESHAEAAPGASNGVDIPAPVRQNLGMTFIATEARRVEHTLRVPGQFEYLPSARREHHAVLSGRVELLVSQFDRVEAGTALFTIDAPAWRSLQRELIESESAIERHQTRLVSFGPLRDAHRNHEQKLERLIENRRERVEQLERVADAGGGRSGILGDARAELNTAEAALAEVLEKEAELTADEQGAAAELEQARSTRAFLLGTAATLTGLSRDQLLSKDSEGRPAWSTLASLTIRATDPGVVESLGVTDGSWAGEDTPVITLVRPELLRFRGVGLQSDLGRLRDGLRARIVAPTPTRVPGSIDLGETMEGSLMLGLSADAAGRTIDLLVVPGQLHAWARAGVSAQLEIVVDASITPTLAIPSAAVQRDGLTPVFFRRDPKDPDRAVRVVADLGTTDGRWVVVHSGLRLGDEVVLDGAFQLMLATGNDGPAEGGHFHADGTFHADDDEN